MKYLRVKLFLLFYTLALLVQAQLSNDISIKLKEYHSSSITSVISTSDDKFFISSDNSGKILMYNTEDYSFNKTLRLSTGIPIQDMRLIRHDSLLLCFQKYQFSDGSLDSLIGIRMYDSKVVFKRKFSGTFLDKQDNAIFIKSRNQFLNILEVFDNNLNLITSAYANNDILVAATSNDLFTVAYVEQETLLTGKLVVINTKTAVNEMEIMVPENQPIIHLFFDAVTNQLFSVNADNDSNKLLVYNLSNQQSFSKPVFKIDNVMGNFVNINMHKNDNLYQIAISSNSYVPYYPIIIEKDGSKFRAEVLKYDRGVTHSLFINSKKEYVLFEPFNPNFVGLNGFGIYNVNSKSITDTFPKVSRKFYSGVFLPNDNWMVVGNEMQHEVLSSYEYQIKYYEAGTFNNRFGKLDFKNYLEANHHVVEFITPSFMFDKLTGIHPFVGYKKIGENDNEYAFYAYDLIKDKVSKIANDQPNHKVILDYNAKQNYLLLSKMTYSNNGSTQPQQFVIIKDDKLNVLEGLFKFGKFSNNGNYLLTISDQNVAQIHNTLNNKILFEEALTNGQYSLFSLDENGFAISNSFYKLGMNACNKESIIIDFDEASKTFKSQKIDCIKMLDMATANDKVAMIAEDIGVILNNEVLKFYQDEFPEFISFNSDASKLMISFNNGKISIYDTQTLAEIGVMIHPDKKSHLFLNHDGYFFSNINAEDFLEAHKNNIPVSLSTIKDTYFNPEKLLSLFGKPNEEYLKALNKAMQLKAEAKNEEGDLVINNSENGNNAANLFVLSIGVSDYEQSEYNLTFADKDALDIAKIYGELDSLITEKYNTKFLGYSYSLVDSSYQTSSILNKYTGIYHSIGDLKPISTDGRIWLENNHNNFFIWDFNLQKTESIVMPVNFSDSVINFEKVLFVNPNNQGFYIKTNDGFYYSYNFASKKFSKVSHPFSEESTESLAAISNNEWIHFEVKPRDSIQEAIVKFAKKEGKTPYKIIQFNVNAFESIDANAKRQLFYDDVYNCNLGAISSNGKHLIYTGNIGLDTHLFYKDLTDKDTFPLKLNTTESINYSTEVYLAEDGLSFSLVHSNEAAYKYKVDTYDMVGNLLKSITLENDEVQSLMGFSCINNKPRWIKEAAPLVDLNMFDTSNDILSQHKPFSFENSFVKHLIDEEATVENIKKELLNFLKDAKPNDQVIIFLAGHGVLDKELNYYFAPHDMDFNNVSKNGVSLSSIIESLKQCPSKNKLLLMDSCHSGNTLDMTTSGNIIVDRSNDLNKRGSKSKSTNVQSKFKVSEVISTLFEDFLSTSGITIISASSGEDVAYENKELGNGAFTSAFINLLKKELIAGGLILDESKLKRTINFTQENITEILKEVMIITNGKQVPDLREMNNTSRLKMW